MSLSTTLIIIGLIFEIIGAALLTKKFLKLRSYGEDRYIEENTKEVSDKIEDRRKDENWAWTGFVCLTIGFILQAVGIIIQEIEIVKLIDST